MQPNAPSELNCVGLVIIGRNEGERFRECLESLPPGLPTIYVDSGSTDDSVALAEAAGVQVVHLSSKPGFTAARARNAGWQALLAEHSHLRFIQFLDGDCALDPNWLKSSLAEIVNQREFAVVFGQLKERYPERSFFNAMCDREWDVPIGAVRACGGNALIRVKALLQADGYNEKLIAGEEPDLCLRMRAQGWSIHRIPPKMATHDAAILDFGSWWKRARRAGHAYAEHVASHKRFADPDWMRALASMTVWAIFIPGLSIFGVLAAIFSNPLYLIFSLVGGLAFVLQFIRLMRRRVADGLTTQVAYGEAFLLLMAKFAHFAGAVTYCFNKLSGRRARIIEYKLSSTE